MELAGNGFPLTAALEICCRDSFKMRPFNLMSSILNQGMSPSHNSLLLVDFNKNETVYDKDETLISLFEKQVKKTPNHIALQFKDSTLTYSELYDKVCKFANHLRKKGINKNTPVVLLINRSLEMVIAILVWDAVVS